MYRHLLLELCYLLVNVTSHAQRRETGRGGSTVRVHAIQRLIIRVHASYYIWRYSNNVPGNKLSRWWKRSVFIFNSGYSVRGITFRSTWPRPTMQTEHCSASNVTLVTTFSCLLVIRRVEMALFQQPRQSSYHAYRGSWTICFHFPRLIRQRGGFWTWSKNTAHEDDEWKFIESFEFVDCRVNIFSTNIYSFTIRNRSPSWEWPSSRWVNTLSLSWFLLLQLHHIYHSIEPWLVDSFFLIMHK